MPGKIYLMMGVNSLLSDEDSFRASYSRVVDTLVEQHPDAILYIQSILPVTIPHKEAVFKVFGAQPLPLRHLGAAAFLVILALLRRVAAAGRRLRPGGV